MDFASGDQRGIKLAQQFLAVFRQTGNRRGEATSLSLLALFLEFQQKQTDLAIIHLKQAVNIYEAIRGDIKGLDKETQRSFVGKEEVVFTYLYAPDKQLRYIPLTALYDGKQWLIEKYQIAYLISYNLANFNPAPRSSPRTLAGALGNQKVAGLAPLPATLTEVEAIRRSLPNTQTLVERSFTASAVQQNLGGRSILHFATHAEFNPNNPNLSYVLMGDGKKLTLPELRQWNFKGIDLVVLSACQTGVGGFGQGIEILGFGYQMQLAGAKSTISSLWAVSDGGTQVLMDSFYNSFARVKDGIVALREAQIAMIRKGENLSPDRKRSFEALRSSLPARVQGRLTHPFYWSPFIVIVNQF